MGGDLMTQDWNVPGFTRVKVLGSGGFGEVVLARHDASGTRVAIKYLRQDLLADPEFAELFRVEAAVLASLDDPNVVRLYEYVESPAGAAIVMELVDGVSLRDILVRQGKTTAEAALVVLQGSLLGLAAAHRRGVVHRDYKPENVLIDGAGASKLTDFGIAARAGDSPIPAGTLVYAPPEQFGGSPATPASDVYAATATFYECLTGRPPFSGDTAERLLYQHLSEPVPLDPVPEPLRPLVAAGLAKDPGSRPADGTALVAELRAVAGGAYGPDWEGRGRSALAAAALLLAALWPSGGPAAVQGTAVHRVRLRRHIRPRHIGPAKGAIAAGIAVAAVAAVVLLPHAHSSARSSPPLAAPTSAAVLAAPGLYGVSCTSPTGCIAVGTSGNGTTVATSLAERWNGTNWTIQQTPGPPGMTSSSLYSVSCTSPDACIAVGNFRRSGVTEPLAESWNGTKWALLQAPGPPGADAEFYGVSCSSATACTAVGNSDFGAALAERWNGSTWTIQRTPKPGGAIYRFTFLNSVSCTSPTACTAVGESDTGLAYSPANIGYQSLAETWNGAEWTIQHTPRSGAGIESFLYGVSCTSPTECTAAGDNDSPTSGSVVLAERWNGTNWAAQPTTNPSGGPFEFAGVSCTSPSSCTAVGDAYPEGYGLVAERWNGTNWAVTPVPRPAGDFYASLSSVSCTSPTTCIAVGQSNNGAGSIAVPLAESWDGTTWTISHTPTQLPPAAAPASSPVPSAVSSPALPPRRQAAQALAALLAQSGTDRAAITQAFSAVAACSAGLSQDETIFSNAASSRQALLGKLAALPDRSALPASMLQDLTAAWQASGEADQDFAKWTQDEISQGCSTNDQSDASYQAATVPDDQATTYKKAFAALWTAIANEYGLPLYQYNQI
jgi:eukaryotic-like serine/threonine-protein kinase